MQMTENKNFFISARDCSGLKKDQASEDFSSNA